MWHIESFLLLAPVFTFIAIPAVLISTPRASLPIRMIGLAAFCAAMLPIRMWESVLMACAAGLSGVLVLTGVNWLERTRDLPNCRPCSIGYQQRDQWNQAQLEQIQRRLRESVRYAEPLYVINKRSMEHAHYTYAWFDGLFEYECVPEFDSVLSTPIRDRSMFPTIVEIVNEDATWHKLIITDCAIRRYVIDFGYRPHSLDELVPKYLDIIPIDPFAGQPLSYQVTDGGYVLYSFGRNEKDDGATQSRFEGDIVFRSP